MLCVWIICIAVTINFLLNYIQCYCNYLLITRAFVSFLRFLCSKSLVLRKDSFISSLIIGSNLIYFSYLIALVRTFSAVLKKNSKMRHFCFASYLHMISSSFLMSHGLGVEFCIWVYVCIYSP